MKYPKEIYLDGYTYVQMYEHEKGGTYYISETANPVLCWLDVYKDGTVKYLWNGILHHLGKLEGNQVIE